MKTFNSLLFLFICLACSTPERSSSEFIFVDSEVILANDLFEKLLSNETSKLECIEDNDDAELLQRTLNPIYENVRDEFEAVLDEEEKLSGLINDCEKNCTCNYVNDLVKEHQVELPKKLKKTLLNKTNEKQSKECLKQFADNFCKSKLFEKLEQDKKQFSFEE